MNIDIKTLFFLSQAAARQFIKQETRGKIISIAYVPLIYRYRLEEIAAAPLENHW
jgi:hypothetical protein